MNYQERLKLIDNISERLSNGESEEALEAELSETLYGKDVNEIMIKASKAIKENAKISVRKMIEAGKSIPEIREAHAKISDTWFEEIQRDIKVDAYRELKLEIQNRARRGDRPQSWTHNLSHPCLSQEEIQLIGEQLTAQKMEVRKEAKQSKTTGVIMAVVGIAISVGSIIYASSSGGGGRIFYGTIAAGIYMVFKGFTAED